MSTLIATFAAIALASSMSSNCDVQHGTSFPKNYDMVSECDATIRSPKPRRYINFHGGVYALIDGKTSTIIGAYGTPSSVAWNKDANFFYINDGLGSELDSNIRLFKIDDGRPVQLVNYRLSLEQKFISTLNCPSSSYEPNTWGIGWSPDNTKIYVMVQPVVRSNCGDERDIYVAVVNLSSGRIEKFIPRKEAIREFRPFIPEYIK